MKNLGRKRKQALTAPEDWGSYCELHQYSDLVWWFLHGFYFVFYMILYGSSYVFLWFYMFFICFYLFFICFICSSCDFICFYMNLYFFTWFYVVLIWFYMVFIWLWRCDLNFPMTCFFDYYRKLRLDIERILLWSTTECFICATGRRVSTDCET